MRRAAHVDGNQAEIVKALRAIGAKAIYIREPADLLVGFRGITLLLEIKNPQATRGVTEAMKLTAKEADFHATWPGQVAIVASPEEAVRVVVEAARPRGMPVNRTINPSGCCVCETVCVCGGMARPKEVR